MSDQITILCKRTVVSTKPVQPGKFHHLSALDRVMELNRIRMVYYYKTPLRQAVEAVTKNLRESISEMLNGFPMVTGRLMNNDEGQWMIKCNDAGVRLVEARAKGSVEGWLRRMDREKELLLVHWEDMYYKPYFWSTFYVQLTEFEEDGLAIGLSCTHLLVDPPSGAMFIKAWADVTLGGKMLTPPLFQPLPLPKPGNKNTNHQTYTALIDRYKTSIQNPTPHMVKKHATVTFGFTYEMVQSCIAMAKIVGAPKDSSLTAFEALAGLFWVCVRKIKGEGNGTLTKMSIGLDMRETLGLEKGFFENCMVYHKVPAWECLGDQNGLSGATFAIRQAVKKIENKRMLDLIEWLEGDNSESYSISTISGQDLICAKLDNVVSNSTIFEDCYDPIRVSCYIEPVLGEGQVLILPSPSEEGGFSRVAMVTLPEDEVVKLCEDALLHQFNPTILMGVGKS
ncbi:protein ECERIFERUM 26-like [Rhododendron vialii]|uniref:protein ECERIFERUM 26-like n=1 Tax=Rhododendron vialii TaxID=182163 RepID=UPI00265EAE88|nr:protein ECERIFERUM 26-like [Rhododendron vialii]